jgi:cystathionine beta-synthase
MGDLLPTEPQIYESVLDLIGNTPIVKLTRVAKDLPCTVALKLEVTNPGGSSKDRPALEMIEAAERDGQLRPGGTIVEPTSGNTGVGLAIAAAQKGYRCVFVMTDKVAPEKVALLRAYGAEVVVCPVAVAPEDPQSYYSVADRLSREIPGAFRPNQYANPNNPLAHYKTTGPEIWRQTAGRITHFVAGVGTGGTISGVAKYLKEQNPGIRIVGGDPEGSVFSGGSGRPYLVEGIGEDFWPTTYDPSLVDEVVPISDGESFRVARRVTQEEGILIGGSGGTAVAAALDVARRASAGDLIVCLIPDSGRGYLSRVFEDSWLAGYGFLEEAGVTVRAVLDARGQTPKLLYVNPEDNVHRAIALMREHDISQIPVCKNEPPFAAAEVAGALDELEIMELAFRDPSVLDAEVGKVMGPKLPTIGIGQPLAAVVQLLETNAALLVLADGRPHAVLTRSDVLAFLTEAHDSEFHPGGR